MVVAPSRDIVASSVRSAPSLLAPVGREPAVAHRWAIGDGRAGERGGRQPGVGLTGGKAESVGLVDAQKTSDLLKLALDLGRQLAGDLDARGWEVGGVLDRSPAPSRSRRLTRALARALKGQLKSPYTISSTG